MLTTTLHSVEVESLGFLQLLEFVLTSFLEVETDDDQHDDETDTEQREHAL